MTDDRFPLFTQLVEAGSHRARAEILLRIADSVLLGAEAELLAACDAMQFAAGRTFITFRVAALSASRDAHGLMPWRLAYAVEGWRGLLSEFAAGKLGADELADRDPTR